MKAKHFGTVTKGKFKPDNAQAFKLAFCVLEGKRVEVTVSKESKRRSTDQNSYYWGIVVKLVAELLGYTLDEAHSALKWLFLRKRADGMPDTVSSTTELTTAQFEEYMTSVRQWASTELGCWIPEPNEISY